MDILGFVFASQSICIGETFNYAVGYSLGEYSVIITINMMVKTEKIGLRLYEIRF